MTTSEHAEQPSRWADQRGFTIAEVVLVAVFVAGLLAIIVVSVGNIRAETATSNCQTDLRTLKLATEQYHSENDAYPSDKDVLVEGGFARADEVARWDVSFGADDTVPTYTATDSSCR